MSSFVKSYGYGILDCLFGKSNFIPPTIYVGLLKAKPLDDGSKLAEPSGNGYARVATGVDDWESYMSASGGRIVNTNDIVFPRADGKWGLIPCFAIFDAEKEGNLLAYGTLNVFKSICGKDTAKFAADDLNISFD